MKLNQLVLLITCFFAMASSKAQQFADVDKWLEERFVQAKLPYRDLQGGIRITYIPDIVGVSGTVTCKAEVLDQQFVQNISSGLLDLLVKSEYPALELHSVFRFDDLTNQMFLTPLKVFVESGSENRIFGNAGVEAEYPGGMAAFQNQLNGYLLTLNDSIKDDLTGKIFVFDVEKNGETTSKDRTVFMEPTNAFLRTARKWKPGIICGRPVKTRISLSIKKTPSSDDNSYHYHVDRDFARDEYAFGLEHLDIFLCRGYWSRCHKVNVVSFVYNNDIPDAFVYKQGDLEACQKLEAAIRTNTLTGCYGHSDGVFRRTELFTYSEE